MNYRGRCPGKNMLIEIPGDIGRYTTNLIIDDPLMPYESGEIFERRKEACIQFQNYLSARKAIRDFIKDDEPSTP